jgi:hypothetical protein
VSALRVNEIAALTYTTREAANWWALYRARGPVERFTIVKSYIPGDVVDVACDDRQDAEWLRNHLIAQGIPKSALKVIA